ncbi:hypothetical protein ACKKBG_A19195 [Auxenochlorella protothecoides x Auxenochlorella symbiontica]
MPQGTGPQAPASLSLHAPMRADPPPCRNGGARGRVMAAFDILSWKKGSAGVTVQDAQAYVATLRRIFSPGHEEGGRRDSGDETSDSPTLDEAGFLAAVTNAESGFAMYEVLPALCHSLA